MCSFCILCQSWENPKDQIDCKVTKDSYQIQINILINLESENREDIITRCSTQIPVPYSPFTGTWVVFVLKAMVNVSAYSPPSEHKETPCCAILSV